MTTSKVAQMNLYAGATTSVSQVNNSQTDDFSKIFATQSADAGSKAQAKTETEDVNNAEGSNIAGEADAAKDTNEVKEKNATEETTQAKDAEEATDVSDVENTKDTAQTGDESELDTEKVMEAITEIMATIQNVLGVTQEELQSALEELGVTPEELLNTDMIPKIVVALTEGADELSIMTNEQLFANIQEITTKVEGLLTELSQEMKLSKEALQEMIQNMPQAEETVEEPVRVIMPENTTDIPTSEENRIQVSVERAEPVRNTDERSQSGSAGADQQMTFAQTVVEQMEQAVAKTETTYSAYTTTENIMNQIQDVIKVIQSQDMTEMELQLHPASLGNVRVQLSVKEGVLTASFTTENEVVKAALESQMIVLKQNFEEQGIKVEAVEVTVATHEFERNLDQHEEGSGEEAFAEKKKSGRRISLSELMNELDEDTLSDEDRIVAEMMKQNGNTVDYTV